MKYNESQLKQESKKNINTEAVDKVYRQTRIIYETLKWAGDNVNKVLAICRNFSRPYLITGGEALEYHLLTGGESYWILEGALEEMGEKILSLSKDRIAPNILEFDFRVQQTRYGEHLKHFRVFVYTMSFSELMKLQEKERYALPQTFSLCMDRNSGLLDQNRGDEFEQYLANIAPGGFLDTDLINPNHHELIPRTMGLRELGRPQENGRPGQLFQNENAQNRSANHSVFRRNHTLLEKVGSSRAAASVLEELKGNLNVLNEPRLIRALEDLQEADLP